MKLISALIIFLFLNFGCSNGSSSSSSGGSGLFGFLAGDPYIYNAIFYYDANENGLWDEGEMVSTATDVNGNASFPSPVPEGGIIAQLIGGTMDGFIYWTKMRARSNGTGNMVINPMTTLLVNGFTEDQVLSLFESAGITLTADQLYENPMSSPYLLMATVSLAQGLLGTSKGFSLSPSDVIIQGPSVQLANNYAQSIFENSAKIYSDVITPDKFNANLTDLSKQTSSFLDYIKRYGTDDFMADESVDTSRLDSAENVIAQKFNDSTNALMPITLRASGTDFAANAVANVWFPPDDYDIIGFNFESDATRINDNTIGNYPQGPQRMRLDLIGAKLTGNSLTVNNLDQGARKISYTFNSDTNQLSLTETFTQTNGDLAGKVSFSRGLPISSTSYIANMVFKTASATNASETFFRFLGSGEAVSNYYGVDIDSWTVNTSRTNNCITGATPTYSVTYNCSADDVSVYYNSQKDGTSIASYNALTHYDEIGATPTFSSFSFIYKNRKIGVPNTDKPQEYEISDLAVVPGTLVLDTTGCADGGRCTRVVGEGDANLREPMNKSVDLDFLIGYDNFPSNYQVYAVNSFKIRIGEAAKLELDVSKFSCFYKAGMIYLKLPPLTTGIVRSPIEYILLDVISRKGAALSQTNDWIDNSQLKFQYRDIEGIEIKQLFQ